MLQTAGAVCARISRQIVPNPFVFAIILSAVVYLMGIALTDAGPFEMVGHWYDGFWNLLQFAMQMVIILVTGFVVAYHPRVRAGILRALFIALARSGQPCPADREMSRWSAAGRGTSLQRPVVQPSIRRWNSSSPEWRWTPACGGASSSARRARRPAWR